MKNKYQEVNNKTNIKTKSNRDTNSGTSLYKINEIEITNNDNIINNMEQEEITKKNKIKKCCDFICSKFCNSNKRSKNFYMKGWREYLEREGNEASDKPFKILTNLTKEYLSQNSGYDDKKIEDYNIDDNSIKKEEN